MKTKQKWGWAIWFGVIFLSAYSPVVSPYGMTAKIVGIPLQVVIWLGLTILLAVSISIFALRFEGADREN